MSVIDVAEVDFEREVIARSHEVPVVVDFWAEWCAPCRALGPVLEQATAKREGKVVLAKVDTDANPGISQTFGIQGIPAVKAFKDGVVVEEFVGAQGPAMVERFFDLLVPTQADDIDIEAAVKALDAGDREGGVDLLLDAIPGAGDHTDDLRRMIVAVLDELGVEHPAARDARRRLATALY